MNRCHLCNRSTKTESTRHGHSALGTWHLALSTWHLALLRLSAKGACVGAGMQRLSTVPAESRLRSLTRLETRLNVVGRLFSAAEVQRSGSGPASHVRSHVIFATPSSGQWKRRPCT